jgi:DNA-binding NarL/FixJ family response regulator
MVTNVRVCHRDGLVADAICSFLTEQGFHVEFARTFDELLSISEVPYACVVDMGMPDVLEGIQRIAATSGSPRVLALVNHESQVRLALAAGADTCVASTEGLDRLVHLLRSDIVRSPRASSEVARRDLARARMASSGPRLTAREFEVLAGLVRGESTKALAARLHVRPATARTHVQHLLAKLGVHSRLQAVAFVIDNPIDRMPDWEASGGVDLGRGDGWAG